MIGSGCGFLLLFGNICGTGGVNTDIQKTLWETNRTMEIINMQYELLICNIEIVDVCQSKCW